MPVSALCSSSCISEYDASTQSTKLTMSSGSLDDFDISHNSHAVDAVELKIILVRTCLVDVI